MTDYIENNATDSFSDTPFTPVIGDTWSGSLIGGVTGTGEDVTDDFLINVIQGYTYTFSLSSAEFAGLYVYGNTNIVFGSPGIDGDPTLATFTAETTGVFTIVVGTDFVTPYTISLVSSSIETVDPNIPTEGNDTVFGTDGADNATLLGGDDRFLGGKGSDTVDGGAGEDHIFGQNGADYLIGGADDDKISGGFGADTLEGGTGRDNLSGNAGNDSIDGGDGNDVLSGGGGHDTMNGGNNNDRMYGGGGNDVMSAGNGNDKMQGHTGDDYMSGDVGKDLIRGGAGNDTIVGGAGDDTLRGDGGVDTFVFDFGMNRDVIRDFQDGFDLLDFSAAGITDISQLTLTQVGNHVVINLSPSDFVTVRNIDLADLTNDDFIFDDIFELG